jgi:hypothetical protein
MRAEEQWPGRDFDDRPNGGVARLTGRTTGLTEPAVMPRGMQPPNEPIDTDFQEIPTPDGGVIIRFGGPELLTVDDDEPAVDDDFYENLALAMDASDLAIVAEELLEGIEADKQSRSVWMADIERGMSVLGLQLKQPRAEATGEGVSQVDHPLLLEATILHQSNACAELLPSAGPVKIDNGGHATAITDLEAKQLEKDFNQYLTVHRPEYVPDTERMLYQQGFAGMGFKKIFHCPLRRAVVSDAIAPGDFIVSNTATSLFNCGRKTHRIKMRPAVMKRMQYIGAYRDVDLQQPTDDVTGIERKTASIQGINPNTQRVEDTDFTVYECACEIDMPGDRHMEKGKATGLPRPYIVTIEKDSRQILEIRRNWVDGDDLFTERRRFVDYPFVPMFGFYASGLLNILGNTNSALTAGWRIMVDAGMFGNFPGGMYLKNGDRQTDNNFRAAPGEFAPVDGGGADDIRKVVAPYPYREPGPATQAFFKDVSETGQRVGGTANIPVAEGKADAPVGTTLAALEQVAKMVSAVHRRSHQSQSLEFQIMLELIREKPDDFVKFFQRDGFWTVERLTKALNNWSLIPRADPNTPTQMHRIIKAMGLKQLEMASPDRYDGKKVDAHVMRTALSIDDPEEFFAPPAPPGALPPDPTLAVAGIVAQTEQMKAQSKERIEGQKAQLKVVELKTKEQIEAGKLKLGEQKIEADLIKAGEKETATTEREIMKASIQLEDKAADRDHQASQSDADREHQTKEGDKGRQSSEKLAKMKPKPTGGGSKK